jgi:hypothetical protein
MACLQKLPRNHNGVMQRKAAQTSGGLLFIATGCLRADAYFMLLSFDSSLTVRLIVVDPERDPPGHFLHGYVFPRKLVSAVVASGDSPRN